MNNTWHFLREFESKELIKRFIKNKFEYSLSTSKAYEIASAFTQGREYFNSYNTADISVKPLLQYYGIVALSRGLILILNKDARENNITPSHGLKIKNWNEVAKSGKLEDIILRSSKGTFTELINATNNKSNFRAGCSGINWGIRFDIPPEQIEINLRELAFCFPDLKKSVDTWLDMNVPSRELMKLKVVDNKVEMELRGGNSDGILNTIFDDKFYSNVEILPRENESTVKVDADHVLNFSQKWVSHFSTLGDPFISPPFSNNHFLNDIAKMYSMSFIFGTVSRYYPTTWGNINKGIINDSMLPFIINLMDFLQDKYPRIIIDFLETPYSLNEE